MFKNLSKRDKLVKKNTYVKLSAWPYREMIHSKTITTQENECDVTSLGSKQCLKLQHLIIHTNTTKSCH